MLGQPRMGKMIHATVQENDRQIIVQTVFLKPENLSQSTAFINQKDEYYPVNLDRISPLSSAFNSDGIWLLSESCNLSNHFPLQMNIHEKNLIERRKKSGHNRRMVSTLRV